MLHLKRFALVEKPQAEVSVVDSTGDPESAGEPKRTPAVEMAIRKNKVSRLNVSKRRIYLEMFSLDIVYLLMLAFSCMQSPVVLDPTVSLGPIVPIEADKENSQDDGPMAAYDVKSVVHHIGGTAWSGHYTCDAIRQSDSKGGKEKSEQWVSFDDGTTSATTADGVLKSEKSQKTAYMLLYTVEEQSA